MGGCFQTLQDVLGMVAAGPVPQHARTCWEAFFQHFPISFLCKEFGAKKQCWGLCPGSIPPSPQDVAELLAMGAVFWDCMGIAPK